MEDRRRTTFCILGSGHSFVSWGPMTSEGNLRLRDWAGVCSSFAFVVFCFCFCFTKVTKPQTNHFYRAKEI